jgi:hypothetical protein
MTCQQPARGFQKHHKQLAGGSPCQKPFTKELGAQWLSEGLFSPALFFLWFFVIALFGCFSGMSMRTEETASPTANCQGPAQRPGSAAWQPAAGQSAFARPGFTLYAGGICRGWPLAPRTQPAVKRAIRALFLVMTAVLRVFSTEYSRDLMSAMADRPLMSAVGYGR